MNDVTVRKWIAKAEGDLKTGRDELKTRSPVTDTICFHMQQCAEKYLKAFLIFHNREFRKTHDLTELISQCSELDPEFQKLFEINADRLTEYAIELRYPGDMVSPPLKSAEQALRVAERLKKFVLRKLKKNRFDLKGGT